MAEDLCGTTAEHSALFNSVSWEKRYELVAKLIPAKAKILDLGGGDGKLQKHLPSTVIYKCVDISKSHESTVVADFNKNEYPFFREVPFTFVTCLGILEYLDNISTFLDHIRRYSSKVIITYNSLIRPPQVFKNWLSHIEVQRLLNNSGWEIEEIVTNGPEKIYVCKNIYKQITSYYGK